MIPAAVGPSLQETPAALPRLWPTVWKLLRLRWVIFFSAFRRARLRRKIGIIALVLVTLAFLGFIFFLSWTLLGFLRSPELVQVVGDVTPFLESVPVLLVGGAFLGILLTSFGVLLQALYLAGDMDFLLSAPVPIRAVFVSKLLQAILPNFSLICVFALPVLYGLGAAGGYNLLYYPLALVVMAALALAAAGLSGLLVMAVVRIFPARRVAEVLGFVGAVSSFICSQTGQFARFSDVSGDQAAQALSALQRFNAPWSPLAWAGRGLVDLGEGRWLPGLGFLGLALGLAGLVFAVALTSAEKLYYSGWASMQGNLRKKKAPRAAATGVPAAGRLAGLRSLSARVARQIPPAVRAMAVKDFYVLRRDLRNMSQLVTPLILGIVYAFAFLRSGGEAPAGRGEAPVWFMEIARNAMLYGNVAISLFVGWMLVARLAGMGFSQEGKSFWLLKTAPVSAWQMLAAKFLVAFLPSLALGWAFLLGISLMQRTGLGVLLFNLLVVALCVAGNSGLNLAFGVVGARMDWEDPRQMQRGSAGCLGALASMLYLPLSLVLFFGPPVLFLALSWPEALGQAAGLALGGAFSLTCTLLPLWLVRKRVPRLGEG